MGDMPGGPGIFYHRREMPYRNEYVSFNAETGETEKRFFSEGMFAQRENTSLESIRWMEHLNWNRQKYPQYYGGKIKHSYNLVEKKTFSTHNKKYSDANNSMSISAKKQSSSGTLLSKPIYSKNVTNQTSSSSKSAMDRAREIKIEKLRKQQEKEEQQRKVRAKAEEDRKKALELKKLKAQQQREAVKKRREEKER